jgi:hypothetical protein
MRMVVRTCSTWVMLLAVSLSAAARQAPKKGTPPELRITLCVYDDAGLPARLLKDALSDTKAILADAGVDLVAVACTQSASAETCHRDPGPLVVTLRVMRRPVPGSDAETAGSATGPNIAVNYLLVKSLAESYGIFPDRVLGCVIAHELGHVWLGPNSHSSKGVMTARWTDVELETIGHWSVLRFLPSEKRRLRAYLVSQQQMESKPVTTSIILARRNPGDWRPVASLW